MADVKDNLWRRRLSACAQAAFERGAGSELGSKLKALHSSSALVANFFDYWAERDMAPLLSALGVEADGAGSLEFEARFPTGLGGTPPHLDVALKMRSGLVVAVESKFTEHLTRSTEGKSKFASSYFRSSDGLWTQRGLPQCQTLAEDLHRSRCRFEFLDPGQLLKHALGLATQLVDRFRLHYLYHDHPGEESKAHRSEVERFASLVGDEIRFKAVTYQEVFDKLKGSGQPDPGYLDYLAGRYFPG